MVVKAIEDARERIEQERRSTGGRFVPNFHPSAWDIYPDIVGHLRPEHAEGEIVRSAPYALSGYDYRSQTRDYKNVTCSFKNPSGEWIHPEDQPL